MTRTKLERRPGLTYSPVPTMLREVDDMRERMRRFMPEPFERFFEQPFGRLLTPATIVEPAQALDWSPTVEISETEKDFTLTAELPGMRFEEVNVDFTDGVLTLRGEKHQEREETDKDRRYHLWERSYGAFQRAFEFPSPIDENNISAEQKDGVLKIFLPKKAGEKKAGKKIEIKTPA